MTAAEGLDEAESCEMGGTFALATLAVLFSTAGQILLKEGMGRVGYIGRSRVTSPWSLGLHIATTPLVIFGFFCYAIAGGAWLIVLSRAPLSVVYPFVGVTYVAVTLFSRFFLHEHVSSLRWLGNALVITGIFIVGLSAQ